MYIHIQVHTQNLGGGNNGGDDTWGIKRVAANDRHTMYTEILVHIHIHVHVHVHIHIFVFTYTYIYTYIYTHKH